MISKDEVLDVPAHWEYPGAAKHIVAALDEHQNLRLTVRVGQAGPVRAYMAERRSIINRRPQ